MVASRTVQYDGTKVQSVPTTSTTRSDASASTSIDPFARPGYGHGMAWPSHTSQRPGRRPGGLLSRIMPAQMTRAPLEVTRSYDRDMQPRLCPLQQSRRSTNCRTWPLECLGRYRWRGVARLMGPSLERAPTRLSVCMGKVVDHGQWMKGRETVLRRWSCVACEGLAG